MPLTEKGEKILHNMEREYGKKKGESVFYASRNKGTIKGVDKLKEAVKAGEREHAAQEQAQRLMRGEHVSGRDRRKAR